jgi:hypothetical protein
VMEHVVLRLSTTTTTTSASASATQDRDRSGEHTPNHRQPGRLMRRESPSVVGERDLSRAAGPKKGRTPVCRATP